METLHIVLISVFLTFMICVFVRSGYLRSVEIQEKGKFDRSRANAQERSAIAKMDGLFGIKLAQIEAANTAINGEDDEFSQMLKLIGSLPGKKNEDGPQSSSVSWEVLREQLKNPAVKQVIKENQVEALKILQE